MKRSIIGLCLLLLAGCWLVSQDAPKTAAPLGRAEKEAMIALIGEGRSLPEAGNTGDPELIQPLRQFITSRSADEFARRQALDALAKLGDGKAQQEIACAFYSGNKDVMQRAAERDLPYIGGWFSIRLYRDLLMPAAEKRFWSAKRPKPSDVAYVSPAVWALMQLPKVSPDPPLPAFDPGDDTSKRIPQEDSKVWLDWINAHEESLQRIKPTGEGIDFSGKACKHLTPYPIGKKHGAWLKNR